VHKKPENFLEFYHKKSLPGTEVRYWWFGTAIPARGAEPGSRAKGAEANLITKPS